MAINRFSADTQAELASRQSSVGEEFGVEAVVCDHWARGGAGAEGLAQAWSRRSPTAARRNFGRSIRDDMPLIDKTRTIAREIYGADDIEAAERGQSEIPRSARPPAGARLPICVAKTQYSFSANPALLGAPSGHKVAGPRRSRFAPARASWSS